MSEDFASPNLIPRVLCEAVEGQKKGEGVRERERVRRMRAREKEKKTRGETTQWLN